jgi:hypothetical protein|tara:strand:+ start:332 stop:658 length:327 start_codon:yes stop_codon:yes gene_type:complete
MTKDQYLRMMEQTGEEIDWDRCPPEIEDFPESVVTGINIYHSMGDRTFPDIGFTGKDLTYLDRILDLYLVKERIEKEWIFELILFLDSHYISESQKRIQAEYKKMKNK